MRDKLRDPGRLRHMLEMAVLLQKEKDNHSLESIKNDPILFYGLTKMTEIIGEAAYKITKEFKDSHQELPWNEIQGMRHHLVHGYYQISTEVLWDAIQHDIPAMIPILENYLTELKD
ncbi:MAG: DUF86 domain-containing protein [Bacteroidales bacterium]|nr:DUF86 domain-containing protein [Bacteroidales bacterium]MBD5205076.1 DUF86 domain-containing protein [Bacteroidales bacterium]MBD5223192.1 DUF86 domain-containing protein [Bacteroidales bacterium]MBD5302986.1 DUF86 domain-containing protein [Bacteroides sp.]